MCNPVAAIMAVGTGVQAYGAYKQGKAAKSAGAQNAKIAEYNAVIAEERAVDAIHRGMIEEGKIKQKTALLRKDQEASFAAYNIDSGYGTPLDTIIATSIAGELDAAQIHANAYREREDYLQQAESFRMGGQLAVQEGKYAAQGANLAAIGTVLGGAGDILKVI